MLFRMMHPSLLLLALAVGVLSPPSLPAEPSRLVGPRTGPSALFGGDRDAVRDTLRALKALKAVEKRLRTSRVTFDLDRESEVAALIQALRTATSPHSGFARDLDTTLLSLLGTALEQADRKPEAINRWDRLAAMAQDVITDRLDPLELIRLREEILAPAGGGSSAVRSAAARLLARDFSSRTTMALLAASRDRSDLVAGACLDSLVGRHEKAVHGVFVRGLEPVGDAPLPDSRALARAEQHFSAISLASDSKTAAQLAHWVIERLTSQSWREACRAITICRALEDEQVVPTLIEALGLWRGRENSGVPVLRTLHEISRELKRRSGRNIGTDPRSWQVWWRGVQNGSVTRQVTGIQAAEATVAGFFGIRPSSDRIVFIIDASGSMDGPFSGGRGTKTASHSRYMEAVEQLEGCLQLLGPKTRFDVVLFNSGSAAWKGKLVPATHSAIQGAKRWLRAHSPGGGTALRGGVQKALHMQRWGDLDLERLEADTVVILCDGHTNSGSEWVAPFLRDFNSKARLLFHTVRIGGSGDGTLKALAEGTGGRCVDVRG
jgi:hypothetical protein